MLCCGVGSHIRLQPTTHKHPVCLCVSICARLLLCVPPGLCCVRVTRAMWRASSTTAVIQTCMSSQSAAATQTQTTCPSGSSHRATYPPSPPSGVCVCWVNVCVLYVCVQSVCVAFSRAQVAAVAAHAIHDSLGVLTQPTPHPPAVSLLACMSAVCACIYTRSYDYGELYIEHNLEGDCRCGAACCKSRHKRQAEAAAPAATAATTADTEDAS